MIYNHIHLVCSERVQNTKGPNVFNEGSKQVPCCPLVLRQTHSGLAELTAQLAYETPKWDSKIYSFIHLERRSRPRWRER